MDDDNGAVVDYPISVQRREVGGYEKLWEKYTDPALHGIAV